MFVRPLEPHATPVALVGIRVEEQDTEAITEAGPMDIKKSAAARLGKACNSGVWKR